MRLVVVAWWLIFLPAAKNGQGPKIGCFSTSAPAFGPHTRIIPPAFTSHSHRHSELMWSELTQSLPGVRRTYAALAEHNEVARSTLHHRPRGRRSKKAKAQSQQYLTPSEEKAVVNFLLQKSDLGQSVRIKYIPSLAFKVTRQRCITERPSKPSDKNWEKALGDPYPSLKANRVKALT